MKKIVPLALAILATGVTYAQSTLPSTKVTGNLTVTDSLKAEQNAAISRNLTVGGDMQVQGKTRYFNDVSFHNGLNLSDNFAITYAPAAGARPNVISFSPTQGAYASQVGPINKNTCSTFSVGTINSFAELAQIYDASFNNQVISMGISGGNGIIAFENTSTGTHTGNEYLKINPTCANDVVLCEGGGYTGIFKNAYIGPVTKNSAIAFQIAPRTGVTKAISVFNPVANKAQFEVGIDGRTSIGTSRPSGTGDARDAMLSVDGLVLAKLVRVSISNTNWADYVFEKGYKLPSLREVESYINEHKHLPGVPSAKEVTESGIDLAEMNATLLKKVEELTLYVIELEKKVELLNKKTSN